MTLPSLCSLTQASGIGAGLATPQAVRAGATSGRTIKGHEDVPLRRNRAIDVPTARRCGLADHQSHALTLTGDRANVFHPQPEIEVPVDPHVGIGARVRHAPNIGTAA